MKLLGLFLMFFTVIASAQNVENRNIDGEPLTISTIAVNVELTCQSEDGKTTIQGHVPGDTYDASLEIISGSTKVNFNQVNNRGTLSGDAITAAEKVLSGVFTVKAHARDMRRLSKVLEIIALPNTMVGFTKNGGYKVSFDADFSVFSEEDKNDDCSVGCIIMPVETQNEQTQNILLYGKAKCQASYR
jgi:hypothetical protein